MRQTVECSIRLSMQILDPVTCHLRTHHSSPPPVPPPTVSLDVQPIYPIYTHLDTRIKSHNIKGKDGDRMYYISTCR